MGFKDIRSLKKEEVKEFTTRFVRHLVVGEDIHSVALYKSLKEKFGEAEVALLCKKELSPLELLPHGPSDLRGDTNINLFKEMFPEAKISIHEEEAEYFKEQEFRKFSGRGRCEPLLWGEEYYKSKRADINLSEIYPFLNDLEFFKMLNLVTLKNAVTDIHQIDASDLIENANWSLETTVGESIQAEHLYWGAGPQSFLSSYKDKNKLTNKFIEFCESTEAPASLYLKFIYDEPISEKAETLFVPLSYTHEWGHFIGEFGTENGKQSIEFILYVDIFQQNEEDISRKIRLLKRHVEKIFKKAKNISSTEFIYLESHTACPKIDDSLYKDSFENMPNLEMISTNGLITVNKEGSGSFEDSLGGVTHLMRALVKQRLIERNFS